MKRKVYLLQLIAVFVLQIPGARAQNKHKESAAVKAVLELNIKLMLEGPFNGATMDAYTNIAGFPLAQPYNVAPWNYNGTESVVSLPNANIVDWVLIEAYDAASVFEVAEPTKVVSRAGFVLDNGSVVDLDGFSNLTVEADITQKLYIIIRQRNHLPVLSSSNLIDNGTGVYFYDFSDSAEKAFGANAAQKELSDGVWGFASGESVVDGIVDGDDKTAWDQKAGEHGYLQTDFTNDGQTNNLDKNKDIYPNIGRRAILPETGIIPTCGFDFSFNEVNSINTGEVWMDRNIGAARVATSYNDFWAYGSQYQWGRLSDGHECLLWEDSLNGIPVNGTTTSLSNTDVPGHRKFIINNSATYDWRDPQNNDLWQDNSGMDNPCPSGYRIPTENEWLNEMAFFSSVDYMGAFNSYLKLVTAGYRMYYHGNIVNEGIGGNYWTSTSYYYSPEYFSMFVYFYATYGNTNYHERAYAKSVRCIKDLNETATVYSPETGQTWMDRNLGADQPATSFDDYLAYGNLYQWGRLTDGHELINWTGATTGSPVNGTTNTKSTTDIPGHSNFIVPNAGPNDWRDPRNNNLWQGVNGINNPCPEGFRVPIISELISEIQTFAPPNNIGAYNSPLKFSCAGLRYSDGNLLATGEYGRYWSSTDINSQSWAFQIYFNATNLDIGSTDRVYGQSVRCIQD